MVRMHELPRRTVLDRELTKKPLLRNTLGRPRVALTQGAFVFTLCLALDCVSAGSRDEQFQAWAAKTYDPTDVEAEKRGQAVACAFCQIVAGAVKKQVMLNKKRPSEDRFGEEQTTEVLLELCEGVAPKMAKSLQGYAKDAEMLCKRVVREHAGDMIDAASLGEDLNTYCKDNRICTVSITDMVKGLDLFAQAAAAKSDLSEEDRKTAETMGNVATATKSLVGSEL
eukprot:TRINITY_DN77567_c0_g1_i1.p1 TRINITY_DN77567_c0_g1~~TRINITY_DN77567_c0_g1_i1.p1  ORF type:complete len:226 (+),score=47.15 TRINITY_DN77567_c0_g1_i1:144-821(+)